MRQLNAGAFFISTPAATAGSLLIVFIFQPVDIRLHSMHIEMWQFKLISIVC